jgi:hypothetical protein
MRFMLEGCPKRTQEGSCLINLGSAEFSVTINLGSAESAVAVPPAIDTVADEGKDSDDEE